MIKFLFDNRKVMYKLLSCTSLHIFAIALRNIAFVSPLVFNMLDMYGYSTSDFRFYTGLCFFVSLSVSIFFAYAQLGYGFSLAQCWRYFLIGVVEKQWLIKITNDLNQADTKQRSRM